MYFYGFIYNLYTCSTVLACYVHYKTCIKVELKKNEKKTKKTTSKLFLVYILFYNGKKTFFLHPNKLPCTVRWVHTLQYRDHCFIEQFAI